jgi:hypothetical protein
MMEAKGGEYIQKTGGENTHKTVTIAELGTAYKINWFLEKMFLDKRH